MTRFRIIRNKILQNTSIKDEFFSYTWVNESRIQPFIRKASQAEGYLPEESRDDEAQGTVGFNLAEEPEKREASQGPRSLPASRQAYPKGDIPCRLVCAFVSKVGFLGSSVY